MRRILSSRRLMAGPLAVLAVGAIAFGLFAVFGASSPSSAATPQVSTSPQVLANGEYLFNVHCSSCHGTAGIGSTRAPELINAGAAAAAFYLETGRMPLQSPTQQAQQHAPFFSQGQIQELVSYIADLPNLDHQANNTGPAIPSLLPLCQGKAASGTATGTEGAQPGSNPNCVTLSYGQQVFALNCAACHQIAGAGGMLAKGFVIPSLKNAGALTAAEAMRVGPKPMPVFGPGQLNEKQLSAVAQYVAYLSHPANRGGLGISNFGPVAEGFVGIVLGFGLLLVISRFIGTRA